MRRVALGFALLAAYQVIGFLLAVPILHWEAKQAPIVTEHCRQIGNQLGTLVVTLGRH